MNKGCAAAYNLVVCATMHLYNRGAQLWQGGGGEKRNIGGILMVN